MNIKHLLANLLVALSNLINLFLHQLIFTLAANHMYSRFCPLFSLSHTHAHTKTARAAAAFTHLITLTSLMGISSALSVLYVRLHIEMFHWEIAVKYCVITVFFNMTFWLKHSWFLRSTCTAHPHSVFISSYLFYFLHKFPSNLFTADSLS